MLDSNWFWVYLLRISFGNSISSYSIDSSISSNYVNELLVAYCLITKWKRFLYLRRKLIRFPYGKISHSVICQFLICVFAQYERNNYSVDIVNIDKNIFFDPSRQFCEVFLFLCRITIVESGFQIWACEINLKRKQTNWTDI